MKKSYKTILICIIIFCIAMVSTGIYAYLTYQKNNDDIVLLAYNEIKIDEIYEPPLKIEKGISFKKEPQIKNIGNSDCYLRIKALVSDSRIEKDLSIDFNYNDYKYNENDGYYYYNDVLRPQNIAKPLFTNISINNNADDLVLDGFDIYVYAESVQTIQNKNMNDVWNYFNKQ